MTILVSVDCTDGTIKRWDASRPEGLTHMAKLLLGNGNGVDELIHEFRANPNPIFAVDGESRLQPTPEAMAQ